MTQIDAPPNVHHLGYIDDELILNVTLRTMHAMICTAYRDAAPKTVAQGVACGLPVFYANSGGVAELVGTNGLGFGPTDIHEFSPTIPECSDDIYGAFDLFCSNCAKNMHVNKNNYKNMIKSYFSAVRSCLL